jgi:hypothetical protein
MTMGYDCLYGGLESIAQENLFGDQGQKHLKKRLPLPLGPIRTRTWCMQRGQCPT